MTNLSAENDNIDRDLKNVEKSPKSVENSSRTMHLKFPLLGSEFDDCRLKSSLGGVVIVTG